MTTQAPSKEDRQEAMSLATRMVEELQDIPAWTLSAPLTLRMARTLLHVAAELDQAREREKALTDMLQEGSEIVAWFLDNGVRSGRMKMLAEKWLAQFPEGDVSRAALALR